MATTPTMDTLPQKEAREKYDEACRELAAAAVAVKDAQDRYKRAHTRYMVTFGAAQQAGITGKDSTSIGTT